jgi:hypothetical protein
MWVHAVAVGVAAEFLENTCSHLWRSPVCTQAGLRASDLLAFRTRYLMLYQELKVRQAGLLRWSDSMHE